MKRKLFIYGITIVLLASATFAQQDRSRTTETAKVGANTANRESSRATERVQISTSGPHEAVTWHAVWKLEKRIGNWTARDIDSGRAPEQNGEKVRKCANAW